VSRVSLREVIDADLPVLYEHQADPESARMAAFPSRDREAFDAHWKKITANETIVTRAILCDGEVAGNIASFVQHGRRLIGYWIGKSFWGRGVATNALALFLVEHDERPLFAMVAKHNVGSFRVLEKCGFRVVGEGVNTATPGEAPVPEFEMRLDGPRPARP
jgi:RimJ/RimL family protein N-acetyltransferase